ncbi:MAG TPA: hypothetical protein VER14_03380 [Phototrophicaceae bacterium]|nr:hypothetical protein [Phototrophicaceae bacterium]
MRQLAIYDIHNFPYIQIVTLKANHYCIQKLPFAALKLTKENNGGCLTAELAKKNIGG